MPIYDRNYYQDESPTYRGPGSPRSVVMTLIIINAAIFLLDLFTPRYYESQNWLSWFMSLKIFSGTIEEIPFWQLPPWNVWQFVTYGFAHATGNIFHVGFNMLALFFLGRPVEQKYGSLEFLKFYLAALVFAGLVSMLYNLAIGQPAYLVGASGAVAAVVILFVLNYPKETVLIWGVLPVPAWVIGLLLVFGDLVVAFRDDTRIGWYAHLAGALFAVLYFQLKWNFSWLKLESLAHLLKSKPKLKIHRESNQSNQIDDKLQAQADEILEKLHRDGEASLTRREQKILQEYSRKVRKGRQQ